MVCQTYIFRSWDGSVWFLYCNLLMMVHCILLCFLGLSMSGGCTIFPWFCDIIPGGIFGVAFKVLV